MLSAFLLPWTPWCCPTDLAFTCWSVNPDHHLLLQPKGHSRYGSEEKVANWIKWHLIKPDRVGTLHICCWIINRWKQPGIRLNLIKTTPRHPIVTECKTSPWKFGIQWMRDCKLHCHSDTFKLKPLLQFAAIDSKLKTQGEQDCSGCTSFFSTCKLCWENSTSNTKLLSFRNPDTPQWIFPQK